MGNRFKNFQLKTETLGDVHNPDLNGASNQNGLSKFQRFAAKNIFDTQPKARAGYLKRLGYEMSKDGAKYRPLGHDGDFIPIEPDDGLLGTFINLFSEKGREELVQDFSDVAFDTLIAGPMIGSASTAGGIAGGVSGAGVGALAGSAVGAIPGAAAGGIIGGTIGGIAGTLTGGAVGNASAEVIKKGIGMWLLDDDVPLDVQELTYQSLVAGGFGVAGNKLGSMVKNWRKMSAEKIRDSLKQVAVQKSNGKFNANLMNDFAENPQSYTPEAVNGATKKLLEISDNIFGTSTLKPKSTRDLQGGVARDAIEALNTSADLEMQKLSQNKEANFSVEEILGVIGGRIKSLSQKKFKTTPEEKALKFFKTETNRLKSKMEIKSPVSTILDARGNPPLPGPVEYKELTFKEGRDLLKSWQNAAFDKAEGNTVRGNPFVGRATRGLKELADKKASLLGSDLATTNAKRSKILNLYDAMQKTIKDGTMQNAYVGKDSIAKQRVTNLFNELDNTLGTTLSKDIESTQFKAAVEGLYKTPSAFGSGSVVKDSLKEGLRQAPSMAFRFGALGSAVGAPLGRSAEFAGKAGTAGALVGFAKGAKEGAQLASPETLVKNFSKIKTKISDLDAALIPDSEITKEAAIQGAKRASGQISAQLDQPISRGLQELPGANTPPPNQSTMLPQESPNQSVEGQNPAIGTTPEPDPLERFKKFKLSTGSLGQ